MIKCPKCQAECEGDAPNKPWFLQCECECGFEFCYDIMLDEFYDIEGDDIKIEVIK